MTISPSCVCRLLALLLAVTGFGWRVNGSDLPGEKAMNKLTSFPPTTLGASAGHSGSLCAVASLGQDRWVVVWLDEDGRVVQSTGSTGGGAWSQPVPVLSDATAGGFSGVTLTGDVNAGWTLATSRKSSGQPAWQAWQRRAWTDQWAAEDDFKPIDHATERGLPDRVLAWARLEGARMAARSGRRIVGTPPRFPSAGLIVSVEEAPGWRDLGFADEVPDAEIESVALAGVPGTALVAYIIPTEGKHMCRVIQAPLRVSPAPPSSWRQLPAYPQEPGMAGPQTGVHNGVLISAGGTNWIAEVPKRKVWHDTMYVLVPGEKSWRAAGKLPAPRAYAATLSLPNGVLMLGGDGGDSPEVLYKDSLLATWDGKQVKLTPGPALPMPLTNAMATVLDGSIYLAGGVSGAPRLSVAGFWRLDLANGAAGWQTLPAWPGPARSHAVVEAVDGVIYLFSGLETRTGQDGKVMATYLADAYCYRPGKDWEKLPDLPWSMIAAPSPAPVATAKRWIFILGGVDGRQAGRLPPDTRVVDDIIYYDIGQRSWRLWPEQWPAPAVTIPAVKLGGDWVFVSGEIKSGVRTTDVWAWRIDEPAAKAGPAITLRSP